MVIGIYFLIYKFFYLSAYFIKSTLNEINRFKLVLKLNLIMFETNFETMFETMFETDA